MVKKDIPAARPLKKREEVMPTVCARRMGSGVSVGIMVLFFGVSYVRGCGYGVIRGIRGWSGSVVRGVGGIRDRCEARGCWCLGVG